MSAATARMKVIEQKWLTREIQERIDLDDEHERRFSASPQPPPECELPQEFQDSERKPLV